MQSIYLVRHGIRINFEDCYWNDTAARPHDPPLSENGMQQAREIGTFLQKAGINRIFASPYLRTIQTAHIIADILDLRIHIERGIGEWLNPQWVPSFPEIVTSEEISREFPRVDQEYQTFTRAVFPELDEDKDVYPRISKTLHHLVSTVPDNFMIVSHGSPVTLCARYLLGDTSAIKQNMGAITRIDHDNGRFSLAYSTIEHLSVTEERIRFN